METNFVGWKNVEILNDAYAGSLAGTGDYILVEDYIPGTEVALEGLLDRGQLSVLALFDKPDPLQGPFFEETIYVTPSRLPAGVQHALALAGSAGLAIPLHRVEGCHSAGFTEPHPDSLRPRSC
mgnify:CR=1 FL=1